MGFPGSSAGKESTCNAGDPGSIQIPWGRYRLPTPVFLGFPGGSAGKESACNEGNLSLVPGWEDPLEEDMATHSSILAWRIPMDREAWQATVHKVTKNWTGLKQLSMHATGRKVLTTAKTKRLEKEWGWC